MFYDSVELFSERKLFGHVSCQLSKIAAKFIDYERNKVNTVKFFSRRNFSMETLTSFPTIIPKIVLRSTCSTFRLERNGKIFMYSLRR